MASTMELQEQITRLTTALPMPRSFDLEENYREYERALTKFAADVLAEAVDRILDGRAVRKSNTFPRLPEFAALARLVEAERIEARQRIERLQLAEMRRQEEREKDTEIDAMRKDGESRAYIERLLTASRRNDPLLCARLMRERARELGRPVPQAALQLEALAAHEPLPEPRRRGRERLVGESLASMTRDPYRAKEPPPMSEEDAKALGEM